MKKKYFLAFLKIFSSLFVLLTAALTNPIIGQTKNINAQRGLALWKTFSPSDASFKVSLPQDPEELILPGASNENIKIKIYKLERPSEKFSIFLFRSPKPTISDNDRREFFRGLLEQIPAGGFGDSNMYVRSHQESFQNDVFKQESVTEFNGNLIRTKGFASKNISYLLMYTHPYLPSVPKELNQIYQDEADKFFNSFRLLDTKSAGNLSKVKTR